MTDLPPTLAGLPWHLQTLIKDYGQKCVTDALKGGGMTTPLPEWMPPLPEETTLGDPIDGWAMGFTANQMRDYGRQCIEDYKKRLSDAARKPERNLRDYDDRDHP